MVNPGHSSRGCRTRRTRRIRCDEAYPVCSRCKKARRICLGYTNSRLSTFRPEVQISLPKRPRQASVTNNRQETHSALDRFTLVSANVFMNVARLNFLGRLPIHWSSHSVAKLTMEVVVEGLESLQSHSQSTKSRKSIQMKYGLALYQLRKALLLQPNAQELFVPALLFSFYELISASKMHQEKIVLSTSSDRW
jgi:hypothetical protein